MTRLLTWVVASAIVSCSLGAAPAPLPPKRADYTAEELLERVTQVYANCKSYQDSGVVKTVFFQTTGKRTVNKPFTTAFIRPDLFRFEYRERRGDEEENRYLIWSNGKTIQTWWDIKPGIGTADSLLTALSAATGVSGGSANTIPALLMLDQVQGVRLTALTEAKRLEDAKLNNIDCFRVEGKRGDTVNTLWVDKTTFLVRRIDFERKFPNFRTEVTTTYEPVVDGGITEKALAFDPPNEAAVAPALERNP